MAADDEKKAAAAAAATAAADADADVDGVALEPVDGASGAVGGAAAPEHDGEVAGTVEADGEEALAAVLNDTTLDDAIAKERVNRRLDLLLKGLGNVTWGAWDTAIKRSTGLDMVSMLAGPGVWAFAAVLNVVVLLIVIGLVYYDRLLYSRYLCPTRRDVPKAKKVAAQSFGKSVDTITDILIFWGASTFTTAVKGSIGQGAAWILWTYAVVLVVSSVFVVLGFRVVMARVMRLLRHAVEEHVVRPIDARVPQVTLRYQSATERQLLRQETVKKVGNVMLGTMAWLSANGVVAAITFTFVENGVGRTPAQLRQSLTFLWIASAVAVVVCVLTLFFVHRLSVSGYKRKCRATSSDRASVLADVMLDRTLSESKTFVSKLAVNTAGILFREASFETFKQLDYGAMVKVDEAPLPLFLYFLVTFAFFTVGLVGMECFLAYFERRVKRDKEAAERAAADAKRAGAAVDEALGERGAGADLSHDHVFETALLDLYSHIVTLVNTIAGLIVGAALAKTITAALKAIPGNGTVIYLWGFAVVSGIIFFFVVPLLRNRINAALIRLAKRRQKKQKEKTGDKGAPAGGGGGGGGGGGDDDTYEPDGA